MTIPITPGPFAFLGQLGQAGGEAFRSAHDEANKRARNYLALRAAGLMKPQDFERPEVQAVFDMAGFGPVSAQPTPQERLDEMSGRYYQALNEPGKVAFEGPALPLPSLGGGPAAIQVPTYKSPTAGFGAEFRAAIGAPRPRQAEAETAQDIATIATARGQARAAPAEAELAARTAEAQLPGVGVTAAAEQGITQRKAFDSLADTFVEGLFARNRAIPTGEAALVEAAGNPQFQPYAGKMTRIDFDQAVERLRAKLEEENTKRLYAQAQTSNDFAAQLRILQDQADAMATRARDTETPQKIDEIRKSLGITDTEVQIYGASKMIPNYPVPPELVEKFRRFDEQVKILHDRAEEYRTRERFYRDQVDRVGGFESPPDRSAAARQEYLEAVQGITDPAQRAAIGRRIAAKYGIQGRVPR